MNIYNTLKADHRKVNQLFEKIIAAKNNNTREKLFDELKLALLAHAEAEHTSFYQALKQHEEEKQRIKHADEEHDEVKSYLSTLAKININSDKWMEQIGELKHAVQHHVKEEESQMFKEAKKILTADEEEQALEKFNDLKQEMLNHKK
jgi:hemerythrin superfamily protein